MMNTSRRSLVALFVAAGLSGCAEDQAARIARDRYLPTMMKDPLYTWMPPFDLVRREVVSPRDDNSVAGSAVSVLTVERRFRDSGDPYALLMQAQQIAADAGYVNGIRILMPGVKVVSVIGLLTEGNGIYCLLQAPV